MCREGAGWRLAREVTSRRLATSTLRGWAVSVQPLFPCVPFLLGLRPPPSFPSRFPGLRSLMFP